MIPSGTDVIQPDAPRIGGITPYLRLAGLAERLNGVDGRLFITSPTGGPTTLEARIPCAF